ncbi:MAG: DUF3857 domain-containing protein [Bacteroidia bacterium]|nr:DUF3857 domain-containing protein [Bacteroidia bacterium]
MMNKKLVFFLFLTASLCTSVFGQDIKSLDEIPEDLKKDANAIVQDRRFNIYVNSARQSVIEKTEVITILNEKAAHLAVKGEGFDKSFYSKPDISGEVYNSRGKLVKKLKKKDQLVRSAISDFSIYEDDKILYLDLRHTDYPYTIVYHSRQNSRDLYILPPYWGLYPDEYVSVLYSRLFVEVSPEVGLLYKTHKVEQEPVTGENGGNKTFSWTFEKRKPYENEAYAPSGNNPFIRMVPESFSAGDLKGSYKSWEDLGTFYYELNKDRDVLPEEMKVKVHQLTDNIQDPEEKIKVLYEYMQKNTRYVSVQLGIGGLQTFDANYVYKNGYGDCKALSNYMKSMLKEIGITSYVGSIYAAKNPPPFYRDFSAPQFNHVILCIPQKQDTTWLECTSSYNPTGYLGRSTEDRDILLFTPEGGRLVKTPSSTPDQNGQLRRAEFHLDKEGNANAKIDVLYSGYQQEVIRGGVMALSESDQKDWLRNTIDLGSYDINGFNIEDQAQRKRPGMMVHADIRARNMASLSGNRLFLPLREVEAPFSIPKSDKNRSQDIELSYPYLDTDTLIYHIPENFYIEGMPEVPVKVEEDFGSYEVNIEILDPQTLRYTRKMRMQKMILPAARYNEYRDFYKKINKLDRLQVVLANRS